MLPVCSPSFGALARERRGEELDAWLHAAFHSGIPELRSFVVKLRQDQQAVQAGLIFSWSNGAVEGHVHRLRVFQASNVWTGQF